MGTALLPLTIFAASFGFEEAAIVLYLRRIAFPHGFFAGAAPSLQAMPAGVFHLELAREVSTMVTLLVLAWLCARTTHVRWRAFLFAFGLWDLAYYAWLYMLSGFPTLSSDDVLFLLPVPWVAPVWVAIAFALALAALGAFGFQSRRAPTFVAGLVLGLVSFVAQPLGAVHGYPLWLFFPAIVLVLTPLSRIEDQNATSSQSDVY